MSCWLTVVIGRPPRTPFDGLNRAVRPAEIGGMKIVGSFPRANPWEAWACTNPRALERPNGPSGTRQAQATRPVRDVFVICEIGIENTNIP
jgi:hypothetical protein